MPTPSDPFDVIVLGAGGAGLMCAAVAGQGGLRVLVVDHNMEPGRKILISGGGRCNFTNLNAAADRFISANPHFAKSALSRYTAHDFLALVERHRIAWHEKTLGQLFCDGSARQIVALLMDECDKAGVAFAFGDAVSGVGHSEGRFTVTHGPHVSYAASLVIATGGPSIPKLGASDLAYRLGRQFGLKIVEPRPALVPLTLGGEQALFRALSGVASDVVATAGPASFREAALFTHRGLSGPAMLQASSYWKNGSAVTVDFLPQLDRGWLCEAKRTQPRAQLKSVLAARMPARLAETLADRLNVAGELHQLRNELLDEAERKLAAWEFMPNGTEGFAKAEVTAGGISTSELSSQTMEAKKVRGLYVVGEAVDVTGWLGGYNFQWAWSSGWAAGQALGARLASDASRRIALNA